MHILRNLIQLEPECGEPCMVGSIMKMVFLVLLMQLTMFIKPAKPVAAQELLWPHPQAIKAFLAVEALTAI